ncbi:MAG TPA: NUDIX hydrolase [Terracidiphilus sp.]|jgi:8-oxo-dGTP diphosphatase
MPYKTIDGITSSVIPFCLENTILFVLLGQRGQASHAFANAWGLVGGFLDPRTESLEQCAARELKEETGLDVPTESMKLVTVQSAPKRDPRGQIIDTVWSTHLPCKLAAVASDDVQAVAWHPLSFALTMKLAFDHQSSLQLFAAMYAHLIIEYADLNLYSEVPRLLESTLPENS